MSAENLKPALSYISRSSLTAKSPEQQIGGRIRNLRIARGLNQQQLGALIGVSGQQMQKYERAKNSLSVVRLLQIACVLDVPPGHLIPDMENASESLSRIFLQLMRNIKTLEMTEPEIFASLYKMITTYVKLLKEKGV